MGITGFMVKDARFLALLLAATVMFSVRVLGCGCAPITRDSRKSVDEIRREKKKYFLEEFSGAAFIGKIVKREIAIVNWIKKTETGEPTDAPMYRYTILVKEYWLGV